MMTLAYFTPKLDKLNVLGSQYTRVSEPGPSWPSCCFELIGRLNFETYGPDDRRIVATNSFIQSFIHSFIICFGLIGRINFDIWS